MVGQLGGGRWGGSDEEATKEQPPLKTSISGSFLRMWWCQGVTTLKNELRMLVFEDGGGGGGAKK